MTKTLILLVCFFTKFFGQTKLEHDNIQVFQSLNIQKAIDDSADIYISRLNCNSAIIATTYFEKLVLDKNGQRLVELKDKNLDQKLVYHLNDTTKSLAIHVILSKRLDSNKSGLGVEYVYDSSYKHVLRVNFTCNDFHWFYLVMDNNPDCYFHIDKNEIDRAKVYWTEKLKN
jgi:hypothetical protein